MSFERHNTLVEVILERASSQCGITFATGHDKLLYVSYKDMLVKAKNRLAQFQASGLSTGGQLIIQTADNSAFLEAFWACLLGGITAVPVSGGNSDDHRHKLFRISKKLNAPGLYTDDQNAQRLKGFAEKKDWGQTFEALAQKTIDSALPAPSNDAAVMHQAKPDDIAFIQFSSGSTSTPKGVVLTHTNLMVNTRAIIHGCNMDERDHLFSWMPLTHDMGLIGFHLTPLVRDVNQTLMPTDVFVRRPSLWLSESARVKATMLCSPNFGYQHVLKTFKPEKYKDLDLSSVRLVFNGAEPISVSLCERFMSSLAPFNLAADAMCPVYGLAEASLAVTFPSMDSRFNALTINRGKLGLGQTIEILDQSDASAGIDFVSVGMPVKNVSVEIRDEAGTHLGDDVTGLICIHGTSVSKGYFEEAELNRETITPDGWLNTGDLGFMHDGLLYITGRSKDIIFVNGQNVYPHDLEEMILEAGLVERGKIAIASRPSENTGQEELMVFILHRADPAELLETGKAITRLLSESAGVPVHALVPVNRIPKTTSGKVQRFLMIKALNDGEFKPLLQHQEMELVGDDTDTANPDVAPDISEGTALDSDRSTADILQAICGEQVEGMTVGVDDNLFELGISSLTLAQIHAAIEERWPDQVDITDLFDYPTVAELATFLDNKTSA